jgi:chemotaxis protein MotA
MAVGSLLGFISAIGLFLAAILTATSKYELFISSQSILIVLGGTLASAYISFRARYVNLALAEILGLMGRYEVDRKYLNRETGQMIRWGYLVKKEGLVALEKEISGLKDEFLSFAVSMVVSGYEPKDIRDILESAVETTFQRRMVPASILKYMGSAAPAFGMIGTLVGLIIMLDNLGGDPAGIGQGLAMALVTTLYGVLLARLLFLPAANKSQQNHSIIRYRNYVMLEGFVMLAEDKSPRFIQDKLNAALDAAVRYDIDTQGKG